MQVALGIAIAIGVVVGAAMSRNNSHREKTNDQRLTTND